MLVDVVAGDPDHPLTRGYTCVKGRRLGELHHAPDRFITAQRRGPHGLQPISTIRAIDEIAARLRAILEDHGPESIALFIGTQAYTASLTYSFAGAWLRAVGSHQRFSTMTIDQSAKWVATARLGSWGGGRQRFEDSDVWLLAGTNPLVSMQGGELTGFPIHDGLRRLEHARRRGLQLIVVDPRRTETAAHADFHLQPIPGTDAVLFGAMLRVILTQDLHDANFCTRWVNGLDALRAAIDSLTPEVASSITGVDEQLLVEAARTFGGATRGMAKTGNGPDMGPHANVAEHLVQAMNVVCGRFPRQGDHYAASGVLSGPRKLPAQPLPTDRTWERGYRNRHGIGTLMGELPSSILADEILEPGSGRVRALVVAGGNPAAAFPDQDRIIEALRSLELLVTVDPFPSETARLADYVIAPTMSFERPEDTRGYEQFFSEPFAQHSPAILEPPGDVIEDWQFFFELASRMGLLLNIGDRVWEPGTRRPQSNELLESLASRAQVPYQTVRDAPHGACFQGVSPTIIEPARADAAARFELLADDVAGELRAAIDALRRAPAHSRPYLLTVRRSKHAMNSLGRRLPHGDPMNPCFVHPDDLADLHMTDGEVLTLTSDHGSINAVAAADPTLRRGVVSMTHCHGGLPGYDDDPVRFGANPARLLSLTEHRQPVSLMPWMTAVPVSCVHYVPA